jgi:hypothetical protein
MYPQIRCGLYRPPIRIHRRSVDSTVCPADSTAKHERAGPEQRLSSAWCHRSPAGLICGCPHESMKGSASTDITKHPMPKAPAGLYKVRCRQAHRLIPPPTVSDVIPYPTPVPQRYDKQQDDRVVHVSTGNTIRRTDTYAKQRETKEQAENASYEHERFPLSCGRRLRRVQPKRKFRIIPPPGLVRSDLG